MTPNGSIHSPNTCKSHTSIPTPTDKPRNAIELQQYHCIFSVSLADASKMWWSEWVDVHLHTSMQKWMTSNPFQIARNILKRHGSWKYPPYVPYLDYLFSAARVRRQYFLFFFLSGRGHITAARSDNLSKPNPKYWYGCLWILALFYDEIVIEK